MLMNDVQPIHPYYLICKELCRFFYYWHGVPLKNQVDLLLTPGLHNPQLFILYLDKLDKP